VTEVPPGSLHGPAQVPRPIPHRASGRRTTVIRAPLGTLSGRVRNWPGSLSLSRPRTRISDGVGSAQKVSEIGVASTFHTYRRVAVQFIQFCSHGKCEKAAAEPKARTTEIGHPALSARRWQANPARRPPAPTPHPPARARAPARRPPACALCPRPAPACALRPPGSHRPPACALCPRPAPACALRPPGSHRPPACALHPPAPACLESGYIGQKGCLHGACVRGTGRRCRKWG
jgi:hypothetical protein